MLFMIKSTHLCCFKRVGQNLEYCKYKHKRNMVEIEKDFILDMKKDGFYPKNRLRRKLWKK